MSSLSQVVTMQEAVRLYHVGRGTLRYHIDKGNLVARKADSEWRGVYLIELASLKRLYGEPQAKIAAS